MPCILAGQRKVSSSQFCLGYQPIGLHCRDEPGNAGDKGWSGLLILTCEAGEGPPKAASPPYPVGNHFFAILHTIV